MNDKQKVDYIKRVVDVVVERDLDRIDRRLALAMKENERFDYDMDPDPLYRVALEMAKDWKIEV